MGVTGVKCSEPGVVTMTTFIVLIKPNTFNRMMYYNKISGVQGDDETLTTRLTWRSEYIGQCLICTDMFDVLPWQLICVIIQIEQCDICFVLGDNDSSC